jgi:hypothetical protein
MEDSQLAPLVSPLATKQNSRLLKGPHKASTRKGGDKMGPTLYASIDIALNTIEVAALLYLLGQFLYLRRDITAMLRVIRRIDRTAAAITARGSSGKEPRLYEAALSSRAASTIAASE